MGTVEPVYYDHPGPQKSGVVDRWSLFSGSIKLCTLKTSPKNSGRCRQVVFSSGLTFTYLKGVSKIC